MDKSFLVIIWNYESFIVGTVFAADLMQFSHQSTLRSASYNTKCSFTGIIRL